MFMHEPTLLTLHWYPSAHPALSPATVHYPHRTFSGIFSSAVIRTDGTTVIHQRTRLTVSMSVAAVVDSDGMIQAHGGTTRGGRECLCLTLASSTTGESVRSDESQRITCHVQAHPTLNRVFTKVDTVDL